MKRRVFLAGALGATASLAGWPMAKASGGYPTKPLTMVVPFPAGGRTDVVGRIVAQELMGIIGKPIAVVNKPGASKIGRAVV